jgi:hypothetical protein
MNETWYKLHVTEGHPTIAHIYFPSSITPTLQLVNIWECIQKFPDWADNEINNNKHSLRSNTNTKLTHKIATQLHLVAESCTVCSSRSRRPDRKLLDTPLYVVWAKLRLKPRHVGPCHHGMARPRIADGGDGLQIIWSAAANMLK